MKGASKILIDQVLELPATERLAVAEQLLSSLDQPDAAIDQLWAQESEDRLDAFERGELKAVAASHVLRKP